MFVAHVDLSVVVVNRPSFKRRQVVLNHPPYVTETDPEIIVRRHVPKASNIAPWQIGVDPSGFALHPSNSDDKNMYIIWLFLYLSIFFSGSYSTLVGGPLTELPLIPSPPVP